MSHSLTSTFYIYSFYYFFSFSHFLFFLLSSFINVLLSSKSPFSSFSLSDRKSFYSLPSFFFFFLLITLLLQFKGRQISDLFPAFPAAPVHFDCKQIHKRRIQWNWNPTLVGFGRQTPGSKTFQWIINIDHCGNCRLQKTKLNKSSEVNAVCPTTSASHP